MKEKIKVKPFIKWIGGKTQLLSYFKKIYPREYNNYFEPFVGGGAVFFHLFPRNKKSYINDINKSLMLTYKNIKQRPQEIINLLADLQNEYYQKEERERENFYYSVREEFNELPYKDLRKSAFLIFLNKTCYNGMYRENAKGKFNVPFGRYKNPKIVNRDNLLAVSESLKKVELNHIDFEQAVKKAKEGDFIYLDPPYYPLSSTSNFTSYSVNDFLEKEQKRLKRVFSDLDKRKCFVMLSNSYTKFIRNLYKNYKQTIVMAARAINCKAEGRGKIKELIITNY